MKLKTEMQDGCVHALGCCIDEDDVMPMVAKHLQHDAAVAHALVVAMQHMTFDGYMIEMKAIQQRASELLAEWGFGEGEDG